MPYPAHLMDELERKYGPGAIFGFKKNHPEQYAKALRTAKSEGGSHVREHSGKKRSSILRGMMRKRRGA